MKSLTKNKTFFHMLIEKDVQTMGFGTLSYTVEIDEQGEPIIKTMKINKAKRIKYGK